MMLCAGLVRINYFHTNFCLFDDCRPYKHTFVLHVLYTVSLYEVFGIVARVFKLPTVYSDSQRVAYPLICVRLSLLYAMISNQLWCSFN